MGVTDFGITADPGRGENNEVVAVEPIALQLASAND
jgi:hypothetical protein